MLLGVGTTGLVYLSHTRGTIPMPDQVPSLSEDRGRNSAPSRSGPGEGTGRWNNVGEDDGEAWNRLVSSWEGSPGLGGVTKDDAHPALDESVVQIWGIGHEAAAPDDQLGLSSPLGLGRSIVRTPFAPGGINGEATQAEIDAMRTGFEQSFAAIETNLIAQVFGDALPLVGDHLAAQAAQGAAAFHYVTALRTAIDSGLATLTGAATYTEAQVDAAVNSALAGAGIVGGAVNLDASNGSDVKLSMNTSKSFAALGMPLDSAFGLPGIGLDSTDPMEGVQVALNYTLNFGVGVDAQGFYLNTANNVSSLGVGLAATLPGLDITVMLSDLRFTLTDESATDGDAVPPTMFAGTFAVDLLDPSGADNRLRIGELGGDLLNATFTGNAAINLTLASDLGTAVLPDIATDLNINWGFSAALVDPAVDIASFGNVPTVAFKNISLGLGSFFSDFVDPVFDSVKILTDPLQPIVDVLKTRIAFMSDLTGSDVTLLDLAGFVGATDPETQARLDLYLDLIAFFNSVPTGVGNTRIDLGDFSLGTQNPRGLAFQLANAVPQSIRSALAPGSQNGELGNFISGKDALPGGGMSFPIIENPTTAINLLFGKPVDFFTYHVPGLDIDPIGFDEFYRLFGPFGVRLTATVEAHAFLDIGYDSTGLSQFAVSGDEEDIFNGFYIVDQDGPEAMLHAVLEAFAAANVIVAELGVGGGIMGNLNAFLIDADFNPMDGRIHIGELGNSCVFDLTGEVVAGLSAYLEIGIGPFSETFEKNFGTEVLTSFNVSSCDAAGMPGVPVLGHNTGANLGLHVGADASLRQIGSLEDNVDDFGVVHVSGAAGSETVAILGHGLLTLAGAPVPPENHTVGPGGQITANGGEKDDNLALAPDLLSPSTLHGGDGNDRLVGGAGIDLLFGDAGLDLLIGGDGPDALDGGADEDYLDGQDGDDVLFGGSGGDTLHGGPGADELNGGPGYDTVVYDGAPIGIFLNLAVPGSGGSDAQGDTYISIERIVGTPFADIMFGSTGSDNFSGGFGDDVLDGKEGDDLLVGDAGADTLTGGPGNDYASYTLSLAGVNVSLTTGLGSGGDAQGDTLSGIENLGGSADYADTLEGDGGPNYLRGLSGNNHLLGLGGADVIEGGKDNDTLEGGDGADTLLASADVTSLEPEVSGGLDVLLGGAGNDILRGDAGGDILDGGDDDDQIFGGKDNDLITGGFGNDLIEAGEGDDILSVGNIRGPVQDPNRLDKLNGGPGFDIVSADFSNQSLPITIVAGQVHTLVFPDGAFAIEFENVQDFMTGSGADQIFLAGPSGNLAGNFIQTGAGIDVIYSGAGDDIVGAGDDDDIVEGGPGADDLNGGMGRDALYYLASPQRVFVDLQLSGTTGPVGSDSVGDTIANFEDLHGSEFADELRGTAGDNKIVGRAGADLIDGRGGNNELFGDDGADMIFGGADNDTIFGGKGGDTIDAGDGMNLISGDDDDDMITAGSGPDEIHGGKGADTVHAGAGVNLVFGEDGNDVLTSLGGDDTLNGGNNDDQLNAGDGTNVLNGDAGNDLLISGSGVDNLHGGPGNDTASSGAGDDFLFGEDNDDSLDAGIGSDRVDGGAGNDFLSVGALRGPVQDPNRLDHLFGGTGFDTITADFSNQTVPITIIAGQTHSLVFADGTEARDFENVHDFFTSSGVFDDVLLLDGTADDGFGNLLKTGAGNDLIHSGGGSDDVDAADGDDFVNGGANDTVHVFGAFGTVIGFTGPAETLVGGPGNDTLSFEGFFKAFPSNVAPGRRYGVVVNLSTNQTGGGAMGITISGFENIIGSNYGDDLTGDAGPNVFSPLRGGGTGTSYSASASTSGPDRIDGLGGEDTLIIDFSLADVADSLGIVTAGAGMYRNTIGNVATVDSYLWYNIEHLEITGASKNDSLYTVAYGFSDILRGMGGNDTLGGFGGADTLLGGDGNDVLTGQGQFQPSYGATAGGHDVFDGGDGDDLVEDFAYNGSSPLLAADALFQLDGGSGFDTLSADFSNQTEPIIWDSAAPTDMTFADGAYYRGFEQVRYFASGSANDSLTQLGRFGNIIFTNGGDDTIAPGLGNDTVNGGAGDDLLVLDYSLEDLPTYSGVTGGGNQNVLRRDNPGFGLLDYLAYSGIERLHLIGTPRADSVFDFSGDDIIFGGAGNDVITSQTGGYNQFDGGEDNDTLTGGSDVDVLKGGEGNDILNGGGGSDVLTGVSGIGPGGVTEVDRLRGGVGADVFVLGAAGQRYYDDGLPGNPGTGGYASIEDFTPSQGDKLRLFGDAAQYLLGVSPIGGTPGTALYHDSDGNAALDPASDELIAILASPVTLTPANTIGTAAFVQLLDPSLIGLTVLEPAVADAGSGPRLTVQFSIIEPVPAGYLLEVQASTDLGSTDPWVTIASKNGGAGWAGPANVSVSTPSGGKVVVTVTGLQLVGDVPRQFFRVLLSSN